jgi:hypothetical protein
MAVIYGVAGLDEAERVGRRARELAVQLDDTEAYVASAACKARSACRPAIAERFDALRHRRGGLAVARRDGLVMPAARVAGARVGLLL